MNLANSRDEVARYPSLSHVKVVSSAVWRFYLSRCLSFGDVGLGRKDFGFMGLGPNLGLAEKYDCNLYPVQEIAQSPRGGQQNGPGFLEANGWRT